MASGTGPMKKKKKEPYFANTDAHKKKVSKGRGKTARVADAKYKAKRVVEKLNPFDKESKARRAERRAKRAVAKHSKRRTKIAAKGVTGLTSSSRAKKLGAAKGTKVRQRATGVERTKSGGDFVKYKKDSKAAGNFRSAFKAGCAGGKKSFKWDGRSYSCAKK